MTTPDSKYKHKPSEKHTLEEVLKSLQDLIRNDLIDKDQSPALAEIPPAGSAQQKEKPGQERIVQTREDFAPTSPTAGPVNLDAVMRSLNDLIGNELNVGDQLVPSKKEPAASASEQQNSVENTSEEFLSLDEELNFEEPEELIIGTEATFPDESTIPPQGQPVAKESVPEDFIPLDEELTIDESAEIIPPQPTVSVIPDLPGEISPGLLSNHEVAAPLETSPLEPKNKIPPGTQQELLLDEQSLSASEYKPATIRAAPETELGPDTAPTLADIAPGIVSRPSADHVKKIAEETLPTIEVEETFDAGAYFEAELRQVEPTPSTPSEAQEIQNIIISALDSPLASENRPSALPSSSSETQSSNLAPITEPDRVSADQTVKLKVLEEPATETPQKATSVDFGTIDIELPYEVRGPSSLVIETPVLADEPPPAAVEPPVAPEALPKSETQANVPPSHKVRSKSEPELAPEAHPDNVASQPPPSETGNMASESVLTETKPAFNLDDIPVLNEVVAPPAGSALVPEPVFPATAPLLPAPDRARDIVVRAVAKLNVEMRKTGGAGLDTKTILRLQQLIRQELEKDGEKS